MNNQGRGAFFIKRQDYGRAGFDLLRRHILQIPMFTVS